MDKDYKIILMNFFVVAGGIIVFNVIIHLIHLDKNPVVVQQFPILGLTVIIAFLFLNINPIVNLLSPRKNKKKSC